MVLKWTTLGCNTLIWKMWLQCVLLRLLVHKLFTGKTVSYGITTMKEYMKFSIYLLDSKPQLLVRLNIDFWSRFELRTEKFIMLFLMNLNISEGQFLREIEWFWDRPHECFRPLAFTKSKPSSHTNIDQKESIRTLIWWVFHIKNYDLVADFTDEIYLPILS